MESRLHTKDILIAAPIKPSKYLYNKTLSEEVAMMAMLSLIFLLFGTVLSAEDEFAKLRFYQNSLDKFIELPIEKAQEIFSRRWYDSQKNTVIFTHGFSGFPEGPAVSSVVSTYLNVGRYNVALLNWQELAAPVLPSVVNSYLNWAYPNSKKLGIEFAETLSNLSAVGLDLNKTHLVGHSLGAHIFGIAGNTLLESGILLPWITGLDPSTVGFENKPPAVRLNPGSAGFVSVIHSDPSKYGFKRSLGTVDFWPNYGPGTVTQPGCDKKNYPMFSPEGDVPQRSYDYDDFECHSELSTDVPVVPAPTESDDEADLCNHNRCWEILVDSITYPGTILGTQAQNYRKWRKYSEIERNKNVLEVGVYQENPLPGNYFFITNAASPYGLGVEGL